jgi:hypothetical protein
MRIRLNARFRLRDADTVKHLGGLGQRYFALDAVV